MIGNTRAQNSAPSQTSVSITLADIQAAQRQLGERAVQTPGNIDPQTFAKHITEMAADRAHSAM